MRIRFYAVSNWKIDQKPVVKLGLYFMQKQLLYINNVFVLLQNIINHRKFVMENCVLIASFCAKKKDKFRYGLWLYFRWFIMGKLKVFYLSKHLEFFPTIKNHISFDSEPSQISHKSENSSINLPILILLRKGSFGQFTIENNFNTLKTSSCANLKS